MFAVDSSRYIKHQQSKHKTPLEITIFIPKPQVDRQKLDIDGFHGMAVYNRLYLHRLT